jgi:hypothetical protein
VHRAGAQPVQTYAGDQHLHAHIQIAPLHGGLDGVPGHRRALTILEIDLKQPCPVGMAVVEILAGGHAGLNGGLHHGQRYRMWIVQIVGRQRPAAPVPGPGEFLFAALLVFGAHKVGQQLVIAPARRPLLSPAVEVRPVAAHIDHAVDGR